MCVRILNWVSASSELVCSTLSILMVINKSKNSVQWCLTGMRRVSSIKISSREPRTTDGVYSGTGRFWHILRIFSPREMGDSVGGNLLHNVPFLLRSLFSHRISMNNYWVLSHFSFTKVSLRSFMPLNYNVVGLKNKCRSGQIQPSSWMMQRDVTLPIVQFPCQWILYHKVVVRIQ